jgi:hypothetical protein
VRTSSDQARTTRAELGTQAADQREHLVQQPEPALPGRQRGQRTGEFGHADVQGVRRLVGVDRAVGEFVPLRAEQGVRGPGREQHLDPGRPPAVLTDDFPGSIGPVPGPNKHAQSIPAARGEQHPQDPSHFWSECLDKALTGLRPQG